MLVATIDYCIFSEAHDAQACLALVKSHSQSAWIALHSLLVLLVDLGTTKKNGRKEKTETLSRRDRGEGVGSRTRGCASNRESGPK
jgi:hypothetical protein